MNTIITVEAPEEVGVVLDPAGGVREAAQLGGRFDDGESVAEARLIAWCAKIEGWWRPPRVHDEVVILARTVLDGVDRWHLLHLERRFALRVWMCPSSASALPWKATYECAPSDQEIAEFLKASDFGMNECSPEIEVVRVHAYVDSAQILAALRYDIGDEERRRRYESTWIEHRRE